MPAEWSDAGARARTRRDTGRTLRGGTRWWRGSRWRGELVAVGLLMLATILPSLTGCGGGPPVQTEFLPYTPEQRREQEAARNARYRFRPGDKFGVAFKYESDLNRNEILILPDGYFSMPAVEGVKAAGLTVSELDSTLTSRFALDYRNPELTILVEQLTDMRVYVLGEVAKPGLVEMPDPGAGVLQAVALAGGFKENAEPNETALIRVQEDGFMLRRIKLHHLEKVGLRDVGVFDVQPFDIIYVPRSTLGDLSVFSSQVLEPLFFTTRIFWDFYAIANINQVDRIIR